MRWFWRAKPTKVRSPERPTLDGVIIDGARAFETDLSNLFRAHDARRLAALTTAERSALLVRTYALFLFVADHVFRRYYMEEDYQRQQHLLLASVRRVFDLACRAGALDDGQVNALGKDMEGQFWDLREAFVHRLRDATSRGLDRRQADSDAWSRLVIAMLMATIDEGVATNREAVAAFIRQARSVEARLRSALDQG